jgi:hypothetical protein
MKVEMAAEEKSVAVAERILDSGLFAETAAPMEIAFKDVTGFQLDNVERNGRVFRIIDPADDRLLGAAPAAKTEEQKNSAKLEASEASHRRGIVANSEPGTKRICLEARNIVQRPDEEGD